MSHCIYTHEKLKLGSSSVVAGYFGVHSIFIRPNKRMGIQEEENLFLSFAPIVVLYGRITVAYSDVSVFVCSNFFFSLYVCLYIIRVKLKVLWCISGAWLERMLYVPVVLAARLLFFVFFFLSLILSVLRG